MASIQEVERGRKYRIRVSLGRQGGSQRYLTETIQGTRAEAGARARALEGDKARRRLKPASREPVRELVAQWLRDKRSALRPVTHEEYVRCVERAAEAAPDFFDLASDAVRPVDVRNVYAAFGQRREAHRLACILRQAFRRSAIDGAIERDPARDVETPRPDPERRRPHRSLRAEELARFVRALDPASVGELCLLVLATTGMRPSEAIGLRIRDFDAQRGTLTVAQRIRQLRSGKGTDVDLPKSKASRRTVRVPASVAEALRRQTVAAKRLALAAGISADDALLLPNAMGQALDLSHLRQRSLAPVLKRAQLPTGDVTLYSLRHSFATAVASAGVGLRDVAHTLGHSDPSLVLRVYAHASESAADLAAEVIERVIANGN